MKKKLKIKKLSALPEKVSKKEIEKEIISIKNEIKDLRLSLSKKADIEKLEKLELRITKIEQHLKLSF